MLALLLLALYSVSARPPPCLDDSQRVAQVNSLVDDRTITAGFHNWSQAVSLAGYLYMQGISTALTKTSWLGVGYPNGNFIAIEDCTVPENQNLLRCASRSGFAVQFYSNEIMYLHPHVNAWRFVPSGPRAGWVIGNQQNSSLEIVTESFNVTTESWWRVSGWSDLYILRNGQESRSYGKVGNNYTIASAYAISENVCEDGIGDYSESLSAGEIAGIVIGCFVSLSCCACCYCCCSSKKEAPTTHNNAANNISLSSLPIPPSTYNNNDAQPPTYDDNGSNNDVINFTPRKDEDSVVHSDDDRASTSVVRPDLPALPAFATAQGAPPLPALPTFATSQQAPSAVVAGAQNSSVFSENYRSNLGPVSFPESDYVERLASPSSDNSHYETPSYTSYDSNAPPPSYY